MASHLFADHDVDGAVEFLDLLTPHRGASPLWRRGDEGSWLFRGCRDAAWSLTPSAHRFDPRRDGQQPFTRFKAAQLYESRPESLTELLNEEERYVIDFANGVTLAGLEVPGDCPELRDPDYAVASHNGAEFPPVQQRWIYALAQHNGVPTRLLDWTTHPLIAAYFAGIGAAARVHDGQAGPRERLAVWAVSRSFIGQYATNWNPGPVIVTAPTTSNPNLHAQRGLFTLVRYREGSGQKPDIPPPLDDLFRRDDYADVAMRAIDDRQPELRGRPMLIRLTVPVTEAPRLLYFLHLQGVNAASVFPGHKSVYEMMREAKLRVLNPW